MIRRNSFAGSGNGTVGYVRRSTDKQQQSIEDQKNAISAYVSENGLRFLRFYIDDAISGTSKLGRRAFLQMIYYSLEHIRRAEVISLSFLSLRSLALLPPFSGKSNLLFQLVAAIGWHYRAKAFRFYGF